MANIEWIMQYIHNFNDYTKWHLATQVRTHGNLLTAVYKFAMFCGIQFLISIKGRQQENQMQVDIMQHEYYLN